MVLLFTIYYLLFIIYYLLFIISGIQATFLGFRQHCISGIYFKSDFWILRPRCCSVSANSFDCIRICREIIERLRLNNLSFDKSASHNKLCFTAMEQPNAITSAHVGRENMLCFPASCFSFVACELSLKCLLCHLPTSHVPTPVLVHVNSEE